MSISASAGPIDERFVNVIIQNALASWSVPGCAVAIVQGGNVAYLKGHGVKTIGQGDAVTIDTVFPLASCTKAFTATLIGQLVDDGKMAWDDPVRRHLPWFRLSDNWANDGVALRDLFCHRTGVASHDYLWYRSPLSVEQLVRRLAFLPLSKPFRTEFQYQSVMVSAAGLAVGQAGGKPWDQLIQERLLAPLQMTSTVCTTPNSGDLASPHRLNEQGQLVAIPWYRQNEPNPAGSIHAPIRDLVPWLQLQLGQRQWQGREVVSSQQLDATHTPQMAQRLEGNTAAVYPDTNVMSYGLGWVIHDYRGQLMWSHTGIIDGFRTHIALVPKHRLGIAILSNRHETRMNLAVINALIDRALELPPRDWNGILQNTVVKEEAAAREQMLKRERQREMRAPNLAEYAGRYVNDAYGVVELKWSREQLHFVWNSFSGNVRFHHGRTLEVEIAALNNPLLDFAKTEGQPRSFHLFDVVFQRE